MALNTLYRLAGPLAHRYPYPTVCGTNQPVRTGLPYQSVVLPCNLNVLASTRWPTKVHTLLTLIISKRDWPLGLPPLPPWLVGPFRKLRGLPPLPPWLAGTLPKVAWPSSSATVAGTSSTWLTGTPLRFAWPIVSIVVVSRPDLAATSDQPAMTPDPSTPEHVLGTNSAFLLTILLWITLIHFCVPFNLSGISHPQSQLSRLIRSEFVAILTALRVCFFCL